MLLRRSLAVVPGLVALALAASLSGCGGGDAVTGGGGGTTTSGTAGSGAGGSGTAGSNAGGSGTAGSHAGGSGTGGSNAGGSTASTGTGTLTGAGCLTDLTAGHHEVSCDGGIAYDVEIPPACAAGGCGLVVDLHGYTMTGDSEDENTNLRALGAQHGYVVVQPTAPKDGLGYPSWNQALHAPLVHAFLADLATDLLIDPKRIHAMGFSQGGGMTFRLVCTHADFFASAAPGAAIEGCEFFGLNMPSEEVDILMVHGHTDALVNFTTIALPQRNAALAAWDFGAPIVLEENADHTATRWETPTGNVFEFWEHDFETSATAVFVALKGHCVPGGDDFDGDPAGYSCEDPDTFVFGELAMQFFLAHPKP